MGTFNSNILPTTTGLDLGSPAQRWDVNARNFDYSGTLNGMQSFSPSSYGAYIDGVTDDTAAIQACHDAAVAAGCWAVMFPAGTYKVSSALTWSPYVQAVSLGRVIFTTSLASGNFITISDQYGAPSPNPTSTGLTQTKVFSGQFNFQNTNVSNAAIALFIGGATVANYATHVALDGVGAAGWNGGVIQYGYNATHVNFTHFFGYNNHGGAQISLAAGVSNTGEKMSFTDCTFSDRTSNTATSYLMSINTTHAMDFKFTDCAFDYLLGINDPTQTGALVNVSMVGCHFEWDILTAPYIDLANGISYDIGPAYFYSGVGASWNNPFVGRVTGTSSFLKVKPAQYIFNGAVTRLYQGTSTSSKIDLDPHPNYQGGTAPTTYVSYNSDSTTRPFTQDDSGQIGLGVAIPTQKLDVAGNVGVSGSLVVDNITTRTTDLVVDSGAARSTIFKVNGTEKGRFASTGELKLSTSLQIGASGTLLTQGKVYSQTITPASVAAATIAEQTFTVTGLTTADKVIVNPAATGNSTAAVSFRVSAADTLAVQFANTTVGALTPGAGTWNIVALRS